MSFPNAWTNGRFLSVPDSLDVLGAPNRSALCLGGHVDHGRQVVILIRGDLTGATVPLSAFQPSGTGTAPDFHDFEITDCGQTLRFGPYESAVDAALADALPA